MELAFLKGIRGRRIVIGGDIQFRYGLREVPDLKVVYVEDQAAVVVSKDDQSLYQ